MRNSNDYKSEDEYEAIFEDRVETLNRMLPLDGAKYALDYAYGGVRLVKKNIATGGETDLSCRFYYDEDETADYDAFMETLNAIISVLKAKGVVSYGY